MDSVLRLKHEILIVSQDHHQGLRKLQIKIIMNIT